MKSIRIDTTFNVVLMKGKTIENVWADFFSNNREILDQFNKKNEIRTVTFDGEPMPVKTYDRIMTVAEELNTVPKVAEVHRNSIIQEFRDKFEVKSTSIFESLNEQEFRDCVNKIVPFISSNESIRSVITGLSLYAYHDEEVKSFKIELSTYGYRNVDVTQLKAINKNNARNLRHKLVSLASVQCVTWECEVQERDEKVEQCKVAFKMQE